MARIRVMVTAKGIVKVKVMKRLSAMESIRWGGKESW